MIAATSLFLALLFQQQAAAPRPAPSNLDMESANPDGAPAGWDIIPVSPHPGFEFSLAPGENGGRAARISRRADVPEEAPDYATFDQTLDAAPYRGRLVRLSARVRAVRPGSHIGIGIRVMRPPPKSAGFHDPMADRPIVSDRWERYEVTGRVANDATVIAITIGAMGDAEFFVDDVAFEIVEPNPAPPAPEAAAYLDSAIAILREHHIDSATADWERIAADARADIGGARSPADTHMAIRGIIGALGEKHTMFRPVPPQRPPAARGGVGRTTPRPPALPRMKLVGGRFGAVRLPAFSGSPEGAQLYTATLRHSLELLDRQAVCGWIVDLRGNTGGNMWPMLSGLDPLLGAAPFGSFITPRGEVQHWVRTGGGILPTPGAESAPQPSFRLRAAARPVAVLIDAFTWSSGEMTAVALIGRDGVRTFGAPSGAYTTGNRGHRLPDGALLIVTGTYIRDRAGRDYRDAIVPDEPTRDPMGAALNWLSAQPCPR